MCEIVETLMVCLDKFRDRFRCEFHSYMNWHQPQSKTGGGGGELMMGNEKYEGSVCACCIRGVHVHVVLNLRKMSPTC